MKKIFSFAIVLFAVAMVSCGGNANKKAAVETVSTEGVVVEAAAACDSTKTCCSEACDSTKCEKAEGECCEK